jgi:hypothetical protein
MRVLPPNNPDEPAPPAPPKLVPDEVKEGVAVVFGRFHEFVDVVEPKKDIFVPFLLHKL